MFFNRKNIEISHLSFCLVYPALTYVISNILNINRIARWFTSGSGIDYIGLIIFLFIGLCLYIAIFTLLANRYTIKPVAIGLVILSAAAAYFINKYGIAIDRLMVLNLLNTDATEAYGFLTLQMVPFVLFMMIIPTILILNTRISFPKRSKYFLSSATLITLTISSAVVLLYSQFNNISRVINSSNRYVVQALVPINYIQSFGSIIQNSTEAYFRKHRKIEFSGRVISQDNLIVVVAIGETARQKNFSLYGYKRKNTNPLLSLLTGLHVLNGKARMGSTLYALPEILAKDGVPLPLVTSKVGINTSCYVNFTMYEACDSVGEVEVTNCGHDGKCYDEDVLPLLSSNLSSYVSGYRLVLLHLGGGSHGPSYQLRHPPEFQQFKPMCLDPDVINKCSEEELYNSFDNTILYADFVVTKIILELEKSKLPYVFMYVSDHGESLGEDGRIFHGMPLGVALPPEQAQIPLLIKSSVPIEVVKRTEYPQTDIFDTIVSLFTIEGENINRDASFIKRK